MIDRIKLLDALLDNQDLSDDVLAIKVERIISEGIGFNHSEEDVRKACRISRTKKEVGSLTEHDKVSKEIEELERTLSKREIAFMTVVSTRKSKDMESMMQLLKMLKDRGKKD